MGTLLEESDGKARHLGEQVMPVQNLILIEIQDTLRQPPSEAQTMKKATRYGIFATVRIPEYPTNLSSLSLPISENSA